MSDTTSVQGALERLPYGIFIASAQGRGNEPLAIIATWVSQVSFDPPILTVSLEKGNPFSDAVRHSGKLALSLLPSTAIPLAKGVLKHAPRIAGTEVEADLTVTPEGLLIARESTASLICTVLEMHDSGDHVLIVARVDRGETSGAAEGLTLAMTGWKYRPKKGSTTQE
jgi:flavin reductase (DIM6/NTAB) family NADH-FMN oxidoreductase RutF